jgi:hypothetical protein
MFVAAWEESVKHRQRDFDFLDETLEPSNAGIL